MKKNNDEVPPGRSKTRRASSADNNGSVSQDADTAQPGGTSPKLPITTTSAAAAAAAARIGEGSNYLVALAGMKALESHVQDPSKGKKWRDRVTSWEERAGLGLPSVKLALGFLDVLGVSVQAAAPERKKDILVDGSARYCLTASASMRMIAVQPMPLRLTSPVSTPAARISSYPVGPS